MTTHSPRPSWPPDRFALPLVLLLALVLRVREALATPLWYDELYTLSALQRRWPEVLAVMRADVHPPLHFALGWAWYHFAHSDLAIRSLPIAFGLAGIAAAWALARALFGRAEAHLAALLLALHPWHVYVSQEARSYPVLWCFLTLAALGAWRWSESGRTRDGALFVAGGALALWTHYLAGIVLFVQFAWGLARFSREPRRLAQWCGLHGTVAVLFAPVLPQLWSQLHRTTNETWATVPHLADLFDVARREAFSSPALVPVVGLLAAWPLVRRSSRRAAVFALAIGPLSVALCMALARMGVRLYSPKYVLFAMPAVMALAAAGAVRLPRRPLAIAAVALLALGAARSLARWQPHPEAASLGEARARLAPFVREGDLMFHADTHTWLFGRRYFPLARHRLELMGQALPYFEGAHLVPDSVRAQAAEVTDADAAGRRWFAMASRPAGTDTRIAGALFTALGARPETLGVVRVWIGPAAARGAAFAPPR
jgi:hypothetical protein